MSNAFEDIILSLVHNDQNKTKTHWLINFLAGEKGTRDKSWICEVQSVD